MKSEFDPMNLVGFMNAALNCTAKSKRSGKPCGAPAVKGWLVCRFHGAFGGAPRGKANASCKTGEYTIETKAFRKVATLMRKQLKGLGD